MLDENAHEYLGHAAPTHAAQRKIMSSSHRRARTIGSAQWEPDAFLQAWKQEDLPKDNDLRTSIIRAFNLSERDSYVYHATASVTLSQVQDAISSGSANGLHAWYLDDAGKTVRSTLHCPRNKRVLIARCSRVPLLQKQTSLLIHQSFTRLLRRRRL